MPDFCDPSATNDSGTLGFSPSPAGYTDSGTYQPIIPNCMPSSYPSGRFSLIALRTALSAARRSAGSAARYWATVEAVMLTTIPGAVRGRELYGGGACAGAAAPPAQRPQVTQ